MHHQLIFLLRQGIDGARWKGELPSEAELGREFQVSRMTLRKALAQLAEDKWITLGGRGCPHRIVRKTRQKQKTIPNARTIRVLTPYSYSGWDTTHYVLFETLSERVSAAGYRMEIEHHRSIYENFQEAKLARLKALPDTAAWLLFYTTAAIQRWFAAAKIPALVAGKTHDELPLSCIYPDASATARHAAGRLYAAGYREMVYLIENLTSLGDRQASEVFVDEVRRLGGKARIVSYDNDPSIIRKTLLDLIASRPRPTAYASGSPGIAITVLCHLQAAGIRVPAEAGIIALWEDEALDLTYPAITRYRTDGELMGRKIERTLMELIRHGPGEIRVIPILPEFVPGGSIIR